MCSIKCHSSWRSPSSRKINCYFRKFLFCEHNLISVYCCNYQFLYATGFVYLEYYLGKYLITYVALYCISKVRCVYICIYLFKYFNFLPALLISKGIVNLFHNLRRLDFKTHLFLRRSLPFFKIIG